MKNRFFLGLLFACCFLFGSPIANAYDLALDNGIELDIVKGKTGSPIYSLTIPDKYFKDDELVMPLEISLSQESGITTFIIYTKNLQFYLPASFTGQYLLEIKIGDILHSKNINL